MATLDVARFLPSLRSTAGGGGCQYEREPRYLEGILDTNLGGTELGVSASCLRGSSGSVIFEEFEKAINDWADIDWELED